MTCATFSGGRREDGDRGGDDSSDLGSGDDCDGDLGI